MVRRLNEKYDYPVSSSFGVLYDEFTYSIGRYPDNRCLQKKLPSDSHFTNIYDFLGVCNKLCDNSLPASLDEFLVVDFNNLESKLSLCWLDEEGVRHDIYARLYNYPSPVTTPDLKKYGIKLKY